MRLLVGILIGALAAGLYFNPEATKQMVADAADWVKTQVSDDTEINITIPKISVDKLQ